MIQLFITNARHNKNNIGTITIHISSYIAMYIAIHIHISTYQTNCNYSRIYKAN